MADSQAHSNPIHAVWANSALQLRNEAAARLFYLASQLRGNDVAQRPAFISLARRLYSGMEGVDWIAAGLKFLQPQDMAAMIVILTRGSETQTAPVPDPMARPLVHDPRLAPRPFAAEERRPPPSREPQNLNAQRKLQAEQAAAAAAAARSKITVGDVMRQLRVAKREAVLGVLRKAAMAAEKAAPGSGSGGFPVSLIDPLTILRIRLPGRGCRCTHLQPFDVLVMAEQVLVKKPQSFVRCPVLGCPSVFNVIEDLAHDELLLSIIKSVPATCEQVLIFTDGTFRMLAPTKPVKTEIDLTTEDSPLMKQRALQGTGMPAVSAAYSNARIPVPTPGIVSPSIALDVMDTTTPRPAGFATSGGFPVDTLLPAATAITPPASGPIGNFEVPFTFGLQSAERQVPSPSPLGVSSGVPAAAGRPVATSTAAPMEGVTTTSTAPRVTTPIPSPATTPRVPSMPPTPAAAAASQSLLQGGPALLLPGSSAAPAPPAAVRTPSLLDGVSVGLDMRHVVMDNMLNKFIANSSTAAVSAANSPYTPRVSTPPGASPTTTPKQSRANKPAAVPAPAPSKPSPSATRTAASASHGGRVRPPTQPALPVQNQALAAAVAAATLSPRPEGSSAERAMRKAEMRKTDYRSIVEQYRAAGAPLPPNLQAQVDRDAAAAAGVEVPNVVTSTTTTPPAVGQKRSDSPPAPGEEPPRKKSRTSNEGVGLNLSGDSAASGGGTRPPDEMDLTTTEELEHGFVALQPQHTTGNVMVTKRRPPTEPAPAKAKATAPTTPRFAGSAMGALPAHLVPPTERPRKDAARSGTGSPRMQSAAPPVGSTRPGQAPLRQQLQGPPELVPTSARLAEPTMKRLTPRAGNSSSPLTSPRMQSRGFDMPTPPTAAPAPPHPAAGKGPAAKANRPAYPVAGKAPVASKSPAVKAPPAPAPVAAPAAAPVAAPAVAAVDPDLMELENLEASLRALNESAEDTLRLHDQYTEVLKTASPMRRRANEPTPPPAIPMPENLEPWTSTAEAMPLEDPLQMPQLDTSLDSSLGAPLEAPLLSDALLDLPLDGKTRETPELPPSVPIPDLATTMHVAASMLILPDNLPVPPPSHYYGQRKSGESSPGVTPVPMEVAAPMLEATAPLEVAAPALMESSTPRAAEDAYMTYQAESKPFYDDDSPHGEEAIPQQELVGSAENNAPAAPQVGEVPLPVDEVAPAPLSEPASEPVQEPVEEPIAEPPVAASEMTSESEMSGHAPIQVAPEPMDTSAGLVVQPEPEPVLPTEEPAPESVPEPSPDAIAREPEFAAAATPVTEPVAAMPAVEEAAAPEPMDVSTSAPVAAAADEVDDEEQDALLEQLLSSTGAPMAEASHPAPPVEPAADEPSDSPKEVTVTMPAAEPDVMPMDISDPMDVSVEAQHAEEPTAPPVSNTVASTPARHGEPTPMGTPAPPAVDVVVEPILSQKTSRANTPPSNVDALGALDAALAFFESQQTPRAAVPATRNLFGSGAAVVKVEPSPGEATEAPARELNDVEDDDDDELMPLGQLLGVQSVAPTTPTSSHAPYIPAVKPHSVPLVAVPGALPATQHRVLWVDATRSVPRTGPAPQGLRPLEDGIVLTPPRNPTQGRPAK